MDLPTAIEKYWSQAVVVAGGVWVAVRFWAEQGAKRRADQVSEKSQARKDRADAERLAREGVVEAIQILRDEVKRLSAEVDEVRAEMRDMQREHLRMMANKDAELALAHGRIRQLEAENEALKRALKAADLGTDVPLTFQGLEVVADDHVKTMGSRE